MKTIGTEENSMSEIKPCEICLKLDEILEDTKNFMKEEGYCYPALHLFSRDRLLNVKSECESVVSTVSNENGDKYEKGWFYHTIVALKMRSIEDDMALQEEANRIVQEYDPDGVALVLSCIFRTPEQLEETPEERRKMYENGTRCIHICAFLRESGLDLLRVIPYEKKGRVKNTGQQVILKGLDAPEYIHDIFFVDMPWLPEKIALSPKINNPYKAVRDEDSNSRRR